MISAFFIVLIAYFCDLLFFAQPTLTFPNAPMYVNCKFSYLEVKMRFFDQDSKDLHVLIDGIALV